MDFGQLCAQVILGTGRADLLSDTQLAVRRATSFLHAKENWFKDLREKQFNFDAVGYGFQIDQRAQMPRFKAIRYVRYFDEVSGIPGNYVKRCEPDNLFDEFQRQKADIWYVAGSTLNIKTSQPTSSFLIGWYESPDLVTYNSWIAEDYPFAIIDHAIGSILTITGQVEEGNKYLDPQRGIVFTQHIPILRSIGVYPEA